MNVLSPLAVEALQWIFVNGGIVTDADIEELDNEWRICKDADFSRCVNIMFFAGYLIREPKYNGYDGYKMTVAGFEVIIAHDMES